MFLNMAVKCFLVIRCLITYSPLAHLCNQKKYSKKKVLDMARQTAINNWNYNRIEKP